MSVCKDLAKEALEEDSDSDAGDMSYICIINL